MKTRAGLPGMTGIERTAKSSAEGCKPTPLDPTSEQPTTPASVKRPRAKVGSAVYGLKFRGPNIASPHF